MILSPKDKLKIIGNIESGQYAAQAAYDNLDSLFFELLGIRILDGRPYIKARDVQIITNLVNLLVDINND